ncbi:MAG: MarR family transcriptional regulator [Desulfobacteraceae bacterium]|nr:MarR family transcriptional regulator [Desulfobacteraceae bacterium]
MESNDNFLENCLFFNTNALSRYLLKLAEKEFKHLKISPAHASLLLLVFDMPGISPKNLGLNLHLTPSTITRFIDSLEKRKLVKRRTKGKSALISATQKGLELKSPIAIAYKKLYMKYTKILGTKTANQLSFDILKASKELTNYNDNNE